MGKIQHQAKGKRPITVHSRAARRAVSPSIDLDKSVTAVTPSSPKQKTAKPHVLATQNSGSVKKSKSKPMKRQQRVRQQKKVERAYDDLDKLETKVKKSVAKEKTVKERAKGWEEVNEEKKKKQKNPFAALEDDGEDTREKREWVSDEEMPAVEGETGGQVQPVPVAQSALLPVATLDLDETL
ncbi:hypothetical protein M011DRAFT_481007 [Sporormia fimetaria CBS 119925]|uniref:Alb1-domain-containing protein n=1 Tax=Sporormia fimetaria CBS 119925 TaxID=1340428 RepID=A0A6A6V1P4_9PLEO|nr:hypothetical protein M011DRAFT_481007 [Sporormia fimetaria CBS 119925]